MAEERRLQRSIEEHVLWCREERERLLGELNLYKSGALSIGQPKIGEKFTQGSLTRVAYLQRAVEQLDRVINSYSPPFIESPEQATRTDSQATIPMTSHPPSQGSTSA